jgi:hypothetical protein
MFEFISANAGTIAAGLVVFGGAAAVIVKLIKDRRRGKCAACGCACANCPKSRRADTETAARSRAAKEPPR